MYTDLRLKIQHFIRKNKRIIFIVICIWGIIFLINTLLKNYQAPIELKTTYEPHTSVIDSSSAVPKSINTEIEDMIDKYVGYCNDANWNSAFNMLSTTCKEYSFDNNIEEFMKYVYTKMPIKKKYAIQDYSNNGNTYIYQVKYTDDFLATGLTNTEYQYTEEKIVFKKQKDGSIEMAVGNYIDYEDIKNISENEYLKVDVKSVVKNYSIESYKVKFTNRSDYTIVISDNYEENEVVLILKSGESRKRTDISTPIILEPNQSISMTLSFQKFYDNGDASKSLTFNSIRVMEKYSGIEGISDDTIQSEIQNAIVKFSVNIPVNK